MEVSPCPICTGSLARVHTFAVEALAAQYFKQLSVDIRPDFGPVDEFHQDRCRECDFVSFIPRVTGSVGFYEALQKHDWYYFEEKPEFDTVHRLLRSTDRVLDVGCGSGAFAKNHPKENYVGLEFTLRSIEQARARGLMVHQQSVEQYARTNPPPFDVVCAFQVLEHVDNQRLFIEGCIDVCRTGGKIVFSTPNADAFISTVKNCILNFPPHHTAWFSKKLWRKLPDYFPLRMVEIIEEPLELVHQRFYADTVARAALEQLLDLRSGPLIDGSFRNRLINRLAHFGGRFFAAGLVDPCLRPKGQSITVIYEKC